MTFEGESSGKGAIFTWDGNSQVGQGKMTIEESKRSDLILIRLDFIKPMEGTNKTEFTFKPEGDQTNVAWTMTGTRNFIGKAVCTIMGMEKMVGGQFEQGLASMKAIAEEKAKK